MVDRGPSPPKVNTHGLDPAVARLIEETTEAVRASPDSGAAWGRLGALLVAHGFHPEAEAAFVQAEWFSPEEPRWPYRHALLLIDQSGPVDSIIAKLRAAVELDRDRTDVPRLRLAQFFLEQGQLDDAERDFQSLLRLHPAHPPALLGMARIRLAQGRVAEGLDFVTLCADDRHVARSAQVLLAQLHQRLGNAPAAEAAARASSRLPPDASWPDPYLSDIPEVLVGKRGLMEQAQQLIDAQRLDDAIRVLATVTNDYPQDAEAYYGLGLILSGQKKSADAEAALREHVRLAPDSAHGHEQLAVVLLAQNRPAEAVEALRRAIQLMPSLAKAHYYLGVAHARLGHAEEALTCFRNALQHDPKDGDSYGMLADLLSLGGRYAEAVDALQRAIQIRPTWARAHFNLGYVCAQLGREEEALGHLRDALSHDPKDAETSILLGELLIRRKETNEAARLLRQVLLLAPSDERATELLKTIGQSR
jgi:tetratricopeptide (TPR) repeat protein